jgi:hypothetical protein
MDIFGYEISFLLAIFNFKNMKLFKALLFTFFSLAFFFNAFSQSSESSANGKPGGKMLTGQLAPTQRSVKIC